MAGPYNTPGVYVEEISKFPPSVAQVETAIPAFIGYTEKVVVKGIIRPPVAGVASSLVPVRIKSMVDYEASFGGPFQETFTVVLKDDNQGKTDPVTNEPLPSKWVMDQGPAEPELFYRMYYSLQMYFANGGGPCYIISVGNYDVAAPSVKSTDLLAGLDALTKEDEPTMILFPDAIAIGDDEADTLAEQQEKRLAIAPLSNPTTNEELGNAKAALAEATDAVGTAPKGTSQADKDAATAAIAAAEAAIAGLSDGDDGTTANGDLAAAETAVAVIDPDTTTAAARSSAQTAVGGEAAKFYAVYQAALAQSAKLMDRVTLCDLYLEDVDAFRNGIGNNNLSYAAAYHPYLKTILTYSFVEGAVTITGHPAATHLRNDDDETVSLFHLNNGLYHDIKAAIAKYNIVLPPSSLIAGVYASVDSNRGVFKAPANVSLNGVIETTIPIDDADQEGLNVDVTSGKSINAIRYFTGKGILVWGARTLAGNDNEWRYISVRRFFNMVEESVKKASAQFVFEPNDANTWVKVRAMIENFLYLQWRAGALAGAKPEQAFYVSVGLGETMSAQDILEGRMIVEIGMAAVRPAEFIILQFSHKMQEA